MGPDLAGDLTAETFRIAIEQLDRYDVERGSPRSWLYGIATNSLRRHWRTETRRLRAWSRYAASEVPPIDPLLMLADRMDAESDVDRLFEAVASLEPDDRDLLVLVAWERFSHREVADILGVPDGTVRSRLHRIRTSIRAEMTRSHPQGNEDSDG